MRQSFDEHADPSFGSRHLPRIRAAMAAQGLHGFLVPHEDEHQNEYLPDANERLAWATGFTGSAGAAVVMADRAAVFVDGRYTLQVRDQVDPALFEVRDFVEGGVPAYLEQAPAGSVIGYDPRLHSPDALARLKAAADKAGATLRPVAENPVDLAWGAERPAPPKAAVVSQPLEFAGEPSADKRARIGEAVRAAGAEAAVVTAPSSLAWLFNVRGGDVIRSPLPLGQAVLRADGSARLFLDPDKASPELRDWLGNGVTLEPESAVPSALAELKGARVALDPAQSSAWWFDALETAGAHSAHERDAAAYARFLHWMGTDAQRTLPDEVEVVSKLEGFREATGALKDLSFDTIAGAGPNGAIVHYRPTRRTNRRIAPGEFFLVDSGAQYQDGTTDITRTIAFGEPSPEMRDRFTRVLKGHVALATARFPAGTAGMALDPFARRALWEAGLDYEHGTGHGVGAYLGVHEGPQRIAKASSPVALLPGMILSNEPGYYKTGAYGIRIENLVAVTPPEPVEGGERPMLGFETLTLAPIDRRAIDKALLSPAELAWVDAYHARVAREVGPRLEPEVRAWLEKACAPL